MKKIVIYYTFIFSLIAPVSLVFAGEATSSLNISANVVPSCSISVMPIAFGDYASARLEAGGYVNVNCQTGIPYHIALGAGSNYRPPSFWRSLSTGGPPPTLQYNLYKDSTYIDVWGDSDYANTFPYGTSLADTSNGSEQRHPVYGRIPENQSVPTGAYADVVNVVVHW